MAVAADEIVRSLQERVRNAAAAKTPLVIRAGGTKDFYGNPPLPGHEVLDPRAYCGVIDYEPTELVITACSGTPLVEVEAALAEHNQMLGFEPPYFGSSATLGGAIASGLAGPRRMASGSVRDFMLGSTLIDGRASVLSFGGKVMKNVAGYDVSRALAGSLGTLGMILDVSLKVVPRPAIEQTVQFQISEADAIAAHERVGRPAVAGFRNCLERRSAVSPTLRISGRRARSTVQAGRRSGRQRQCFLDCIARADARIFQSRRPCNAVAPVGAADDVLHWPLERH